jgi:hypothetical protein
LPNAGRFLYQDQKFVSTFPEPTLSPAELLPATRPPKLDQDYKPGDKPQKVAACTGWFTMWLARCAPGDEKLQDEFLRQAMRWAEQSLPYWQR